MASNIPSSQTIIRQHEGGILKVTPGSPIPEIEGHHVLVRTHAVGLCPCDFKMPLRFPTTGLWTGCDFSGTVVAVGSDVTRFKIGDTVFGAVHGSNQGDPQSGAYAEYLKAEADYIFKTPPGIDHAKATAMYGTGIATIAMALYSLKIAGELSAPVENKASETILVFGGSSTVGMMAIQILKLLGHRVVSTSSEKNIELVKSYGAEEVFNYRSSTCGADIRAYTKNSLRYVIDPFGEVKTMSVCYEAVGRAGGKYCALEQYQEALATRRTVKPFLIMGSSIAGRGLVLPDPYGSPPDPELGAWSLKFYKDLQSLVDEGKLKECPQEILPGKFDAILSGLDRLKNKQVSGKKLIVPLV
ncbi:Polyketide synthase enoylreductase [Penicillium robsamsonii]|uniref:Polyketide synthase enoylreductase n=1 Tax=Penicillium robsamsonii TaxID=1792511 RepID=UPI0025481820|nr:Polyketide synthase enoylreductase [Penicillium robsamsonii]KAJ5827801.1 Polyketide synthase enoylreductase [Penicillium robsamsonii]